MSMFVLVHGAYHGGWCWSRLVPELESLGHRAVTPDLPCDDPAAGHAANVATVLAAMDEAESGSDVVVVGHSLGGFIAPLVAQQRAVRRIVFLCTAPVIGGGDAVDLRARLATECYGAMVRFRDENGRALMSPADAGHGFYHDCDDTTAAWAIARLRPQSTLPLTEPWPLAAWPDVARSVILARDDRAVRFDAGMEAGRLILDGADPIVIDGSHSPFLSRPGELASVLHKTSV
jgi:pimeloyl-ACP methyl ester carboxylesterase